MKLSSQVKKLCAVNFFTGLVFWYGIEKLFIKSIGLGAQEIGILSVVILVTNLALDIPSGIIADKWSRKGMMLLSVVFLAISSFLLGISKNFMLYIIGYLFYSLYVVCSSGTHQAIMYDSLHEENNTKSYSKINGRAYALFLVGAGVGNIFSGFIGDAFGYNVSYFLTLIPCAINVAIILSLREPVFHKPENKERILGQLSSAIKAIMGEQLLLILAIIMGLLTIIETFKTEFGQLYILRYISSAKLLGIYWAIFAFLWAFGAFQAHKFKNRVSLLVGLSTVPVILMGFVDAWAALLLLAVQIFSAAALFNQIESRVQDATPSHLRATVMSVLSSFGRIISVPGSLFLGWIIQSYSPFVGAQSMSIVAAFILILWLTTYIFFERKDHKT